MSFSIRDLENLSGIKAHTIRIWEKRYGLLSPERTETNIRTYSVESLQKLLNITLLYNNGYKISKIARIPEEDIPLTVREIVAKSSVKSHAINALKLAMMNFDQGLFHQTYNSLTGDRSFREIFWEVMLPFLEELGLLWQTSTIGPAHEHFITNLIKQKICSQVDKLVDFTAKKEHKIFVLFLPENEIHEIGLLYLHYEITLRGYRSIYLGPTMPLEFLPDLKDHFSNLTFLSYFTVTPTPDAIQAYVESFSNKLCGDDGADLWILGRQIHHLGKENLPQYVQPFESIREVIDTL